MAGAGLNWIRLPIPWWAIDVWAGEPFLPRTCWKYILRAFQWARKYGIRIAIDLHTAPGSQNGAPQTFNLIPPSISGLHPCNLIKPSRVGYNHSGKKNVINFLNGPMGLANAQRMVNYIRIFTEFITQPEYVNVVPMFGIINEAVAGTIGVATLASL